MRGLIDRYTLIVFSPYSVFIMPQSILSLSEFKSNASRLLDQLCDTSQPLVLTQNGRAKAVVHDYEDYQRHQQSLLMLKLMVQGEADAQHDRVKPQSEVFAALSARLENKSS